MDCPKCGTSQEDGRTECISCGIVFERWLRAQEQAVLARGTGRFNPTPEPVAESGLPKWMVLLFVALILLFGTMYTIRRREARAKVDLAAEGKARINEINRKGNEVRQRLQSEMDRAEKMRTEMEREEAPVGNAAQYAPKPFSLSDAQARDLVYQCSQPQERRVILLPKSYTSDTSHFVFQRYPELHAAQRSRLLHVNREKGGSVTHSLGVTGGVRITEVGEFFEVDLGARQVVAAKDLNGTVDRVSARLLWEWEEPTGAEILLGKRGGTGQATYLLQNNVWRVEGASMVNEEGFTEPLCR